MSVMIQTFFLQITVADLEPDDAGVIRCAAINILGKCTWETKIDVKARLNIILYIILKLNT
jgi:hypothetical protein